MSAAIEAKAHDAEQAAWDGSSGEAAFNAAVEAADLYMQAMQLTSNRTDRTRLSAKCNEMLSRSEQLRGDRSRPIDLEHPVSKRALTTREKIILVEGTKLNGFKFPIWEHDPDPAEFELKDGEAQFEDSPRLQLSALQLESFAGWKRPTEALTAIEIVRNGEKLPNTPTMGQLKKVDLVQDMTSDCSVVASLCAGAARADKGHPRILVSIIRPYDQEKKSPKMSPSGRYVLRLYFNGCYRKVEIDDLLPVSSGSRVLHVLDRSNPGCLWPALLEKAYLKVRGGYDFPGSNSSTDIAVFTGWIPEQIFLHDEDVIPEELWTRIYNGFNSGRVLLTIGTGQLPRREQKCLGLAAEHDYAVLEMKDTDGVRELLIKNPWSNGDVWRGAARQRPNPGHEEVGSEVKDRHLSPQEPSVEMMPGTFWMDFGSVFQHFENLYLNWHPGLFKCREDLHSTWDITSANLSPGLFENHLQFSVTSSAPTDAWLLLNRHFRTGDYMTSDRHANGFISLYLFHAGGNRVLLSDGAKLRGPYVDSPNTLLKFSMPAQTTWTAVVASQNLPLTKHNFTLSAFSNPPVQLAHARAKYASVRMQHGAWTRSMAGGNSDSPTYLTNPQYSFQLAVPSAIALTLSLDNAPQPPQADIHVKMLVVFTDGRRVTKLRTREIVADSKDYRRGSAAIETKLEKGHYTIICSTFERDKYARFALSLHTSTEHAPALKPLPPEGSGRLSIISGPAIFSPDTTRLLAPVKVPRLTRTTFVAREALSSSTGAPAKPSASLLLKMSLEQGQGPYKTILTSSASDHDDFAEIKAGVRLDEVDLRPDMQRPDKGGLWLVIERMTGVSSDGQGCVSIQVEVLSEEQIELGAWGKGDG